MAEEIVLSDRNVPRPPLQEELTRLYSQGFLTDITLSTEDGKNFEAHKVLLAARSHYFHSVVPRLKSDPVIFLKGVKGAHLDKILKFIYSGTCALSRHQLKPILEVAKSLQIKGLCDANPTDILQQQQPSALGASRFRSSESGTTATSPTSLTGGMSAALQRMQQQQQNRLSSSSASSSPSSVTGGTLVDKTTSTTFKTPTGVARRSMTSAASTGSTSKSAAIGSSLSTSGNKPSQILLLNGSPTNSDSEGEDKPSKEDSEDDDKGRSSSPNAPGKQAKRKRGRPPKGKHGNKSESSGTTSGKNSKSGTETDPYDFDDDGNDPSGSAGENASGDDKQSNSSSNKKNHWRVDGSGTGSCNLLQLNETITKSEMEMDDSGDQQQDDGDIIASSMCREINEKKPSKYATTSINGMQILTVKCENQTAELHLSRFANGMRGQSIRYKEEWMTPGEFELACGLNGKSKYLENIQTDYGPLKTLTASGLLKPHSRKCRCSICRGDYESPEKVAKRKRQRELQEEAEGLEGGRGNETADFEGEDREKERGDEQFVMVNSHFQTKEEKDDSMLEEMMDQHNQSTNSFEDSSQHHNSISHDNMSHLGNQNSSKGGDGDIGSAKRKKKKHKKDEWKKQLNDQLKAGQAALANANAAAAAQAAAQAGTMSVMNNSMTMASMNNGIISNEQETHHQHEQQSHQLQSYMTDNGMSLGGTAVTFAYSTGEVMPPKISSPAILTNVNDPRIEPPQIQQPTFYVMSPHPHASVTAPPTPQHNPFAGLTLPPGPHTSTPQIQMSPAPPQLLPHQVQQQQSQHHQQHQSPAQHQSNIITTNSVTKFSQDNIVNQIQQSSPSLTSSTGSTTIKTSASNTPTSTEKNSTDPNKFAGVKKLGAVMNVRCKSTTAILYSNKYETGSKGKCIQLGDEWLTPNEFEDRAGSKAKKYLSSIKCMGRPLRVYVNSGELKGTGPPPPPKAPRKPPQSHANKTPTTIQAIAPAPPPGALTQMTYTMAPPTPTHISSAPQLPPNLNVMMGNQGPPILINQTSVAGTNLIGSQPILTSPMTFTIAQPLEVRQNISQTM